MEMAKGSLSPVWALSTLARGRIAHPDRIARERLHPGRGVARPGRVALERLHPAGRVVATTHVTRLAHASPAATALLPLFCLNAGRPPSLLLPRSDRLCGSPCWLPKILTNCYLRSVNETGHRSIQRSMKRFETIAIACLLALAASAQTQPVDKEQASKEQRQKEREAAQEAKLGADPQARRPVARARTGSRAYAPGAVNPRVGRPISPVFVPQQGRDQIPHKSTRCPGCRSWERAGADAVRAQCKPSRPKGCGRSGRETGRAGD